MNRPTFAGALLRELLAAWPGRPGQQPGARSRHAPSDCPARPSRCCSCGCTMGGCWRCAPTRNWRTWRTSSGDSRRLCREVHAHVGRCGTVQGRRKDASDRVPSSLVPPEFMLLRKRGGGMQAEVERIAVSDLRKAIEQHRRMVLLGEPGQARRPPYGTWPTTMPVRRKRMLRRRCPSSCLWAATPVLSRRWSMSKAQAGDLAPQLTTLLQDGRAMLLLDALNEMPRWATRSAWGASRRC